MDYASLKTAIADMVNRDDFTDSQLSLFVELAEASIRRSVRHPNMERRATATLTEPNYALPSDWIETISISDAKGRYALVSLAELDDIRAKLTAGPPRAYAWVNGGIEVYPQPTVDVPADVTLTYLGGIPALSDAAPSNWLITQFPDVYLYGGLMHTAPFLQEDARLQVWTALYAAAVEDINRAGKAARWSGTSLAMRPVR